MNYTKRLLLLIQIVRYLTRKIYPGAKISKKTNNYRNQLFYHLIFVLDYRQQTFIFTEQKTLES